MRSKRLAQRWPCIFGKYAAEHVDPYIKQTFEDFEETPKWGDMRGIWRRLHCQTLNPHGSEDCPFSERECGLAFTDAVLETLTARPRRFGALFRYVARRRGAERADAAQGSRHQRNSRRGTQPGHHPAMGEPAAVVQGPRGRHSGTDADVPGGAEELLRRPNSGPTRIGTLFGEIDLGPRSPARRGNEGEEST